jgi:hypothetical protein
MLVCAIRKARRLLGDHAETGGVMVAAGDQSPRVGEQSAVEWN